MTTTIPPVKKVFCGECQFYEPVRIEPIGDHHTRVIDGSCSHPRSFRDSYYKKSAILIGPSERNAENNCPDFKLRGDSE